MPVIIKMLTSKIMAIIINPLASKRGPRPSRCRRTTGHVLVAAPSFFDPKRPLA
ncbi:hypothetical protein [Xanthomonas sp. GW]|uniref:hypothetical protein n=1 Tax=Xanthomonas sp. GW TaxID=2724121 RepID=UPI00163AEB6E|nr:hypothetical protein [Xanthomonas sp. GW]